MLNESNCSHTVQGLLEAAGDERCTNQQFQNKSPPWFKSEWQHIVCLIHVRLCIIRFFFFFYSTSVKKIGKSTFLVLSAGTPEMASGMKSHWSWNVINTRTKVLCICVKLSPRLDGLMFPSMMAVSPGTDPSKQLQIITLCPAYFTSSCLSLPHSAAWSSLTSHSFICIIYHHKRSASRHGHYATWFMCGDSKRAPMIHLSL